ncbi:hypothetical protein RNZ50_18215 [Paracoccaceae bacterium Fryx2]|nr:hypothetical protein [Paracoccaceae bacterium Fryx2]
MKRTVLAAALVALALPFASSVATAGPISSACLRSDGGSGNRALCNCIQQVADQTLRGGDQRKAAKFFQNPDEAQKVRMSKRDSDNAFWARYKAFGTMAEASCAR